MNHNESFSIAKCAEQVHLAEQELSAFMAAVAQLFGPEQARLSAEDWLEESQLIDNPAPATNCDWRAVTIAASARLAHRLNVAFSLSRMAADASWWHGPTDTKVQLLSPHTSDVIDMFHPTNR